MPAHQILHLSMRKAAALLQSLDSPLALKMVRCGLRHLQALALIVLLLSTCLVSCQDVLHQH